MRAGKWTSFESNGKWTLFFIGENDFQMKGMTSKFFSVILECLNYLNFGVAGTLPKSLIADLDYYNDLRWVL